MTSSRFLHVTGVILALTAGSPSLAQLSVRPGVTVSGAAVYSSNAFLEENPSSEGAALSAEIAPFIEVSDGRTQGLVTANLARTQFLSGPNDNTALRVQAVATHRATDRLTIDAQLGFDSSILGSRTYGTRNPAGLPTTAPTDSPTPSVSGNPTSILASDTAIVSDINIVDPIAPGFDSDLSLLGLAQRRKLLTTGAGLSFRSTDRSIWSLSTSASRAWYPSAGLVLSNYRTYGAQVGYTRVLSETATVGIGSGASRVRYANGAKLSIYTPRVTYRKRLGDGLSFNASIGASIVKDQLATSTGLFVDAGLCRQRVRSSLCLSAARQPAVTGLDSARSQTSLGATYALQLDEDTSIAANAAYSWMASRNARLGGATAGRAEQSLFLSDFSLNRRFSRRLNGFAGVNYRKLDTAGRGASDYGARVGLSITFERRR